MSAEILWWVAVVAALVSVFGAIATVIVLTRQLPPPTVELSWRKKGAKS